MACDERVVEAGFSGGADGFLEDDLLVVSQMQQQPHFGVSDFDLGAVVGAPSATEEERNVNAGGASEEHFSDLPPMDRLSLSTSCSPEQGEMGSVSKAASAAAEPLVALTVEAPTTKVHGASGPFVSEKEKTDFFEESQRHDLSGKDDGPQREVLRRMQEEEEMRREVRELAAKEIEDFYQRRAKQIQLLHEQQQKAKAAVFASKAKAEAEGGAGPWSRVLKLVDEACSWNGGSSSASTCPAQSDCLGATRAFSTWGGASSKAPSQNSAGNEHIKMRQLLQQMAEEEAERLRST